MYNDSTDLISTFCALVMALMMLRKSKVAQQALETKSYKATKGLIKKALIFTGVFVVLYIVWSCRLLNGFNLQAGKNLLTQKELKSRSFNSQEFMQNSNYIRIGFPASNIQKDNDFIVKSNNFNMKNDISLISSEKLTRKALHDRQIEQQYSALFQLPVELPLYILLTLITFYLGTKIIVYFISFNNYSKALENQEKLNLIILHLQTFNPVEQSKQKIEEEKEVSKCSLMQSSFDPIIKEETIEIPYSYDDSITDCKIHENVMSYPIPSEFAYNS